MNYTTEIADGGSTYYSSIAALNGQSYDSATFIPSKYHQDPTIRLILYFHGHQTSYPDLRAFLHRPNTRPLRKAAGADGRYALVMPWLGQNSNASHIVGTPAAFALYLGTVINNLWGQVAPPLITFVPNLEIVLASHSGGGVAMTTAITLGGSGYTGVMNTAWGLDCFYSPGEIITASSTVSAPWISWASADPKRVLELYYTGGTPSLNSKAIVAAGLPNVHGHQSGVGHDETPVQYFPVLLKAMP